MRAILITAVATSLPMKAGAEDHSLFADLTVSSGLIDRGELLAQGVMELSAGASASVGAFELYASGTRILPFGEAQAAFDDEMDYTAGVIWLRPGYSVDVSANLLTYPGEGEGQSLELAATVSTELPYRPALSAFHDADLGDWGLEASAGPEWEIGDWSVYALGRAGFVQFGDGSAARSYGGVEAGASRRLSGAVTFGIYGRAEVADEDSFMSGDVASRAKSIGYAAGVQLSMAY